MKVTSPSHTALHLQLHTFNYLNNAKILSKFYNVHLTVNNSVFPESWKHNKALLPVSLPLFSLLAVVVYVLASLKFCNLSHSVRVGLLLSLCRDYSQRELKKISKPLLKLLMETINFTNQFHPSVRKKRLDKQRVLNKECFEDLHHQGGGGIGPESLFGPG